MRTLDESCCDTLDRLRGPIVGGTESARLLKEKGGQQGIFLAMVDVPCRPPPDDVFHTDKGARWELTNARDREGGRSSP